MRREFKNLSICRLVEATDTIQFCDGNYHLIASISATPTPNLACSITPIQRELMPEEFSYLAEVLEDFDRYLQAAKMFWAGIDVEGRPASWLPCPLPQLLRAEYWAYYGRTPGFCDWYGQERLGIVASDLIADFLIVGTGLEVLPMTELHRASHAVTIHTPGPGGTWVNNYRNAAAYYGLKLAKKEGGPTS
jgi:hypothetical protein